MTLRKIRYNLQGRFQLIKSMNGSLSFRKGESSQQVIGASDRLLIQDAGFFLTAVFGRSEDYASLIGLARKRTSE